MTKIWAGVFWGERDTAPSREPMADGRLGSPLWMVVATATLVAGSIAFSVWAGPLHELSLRAAGDLLDPSVYVEAVLGVDR